MSEVAATPERVSGIAEAIATGAATPTEVLEATLDRIAATDDVLRAWRIVDAERARRDAGVLTAEARAGRVRSVLHGVPVAVKEEFDVAGLPNPMRGPDTEPARRDATCVARLRSAGAIVVGTTAMAIAGTPPPTRNPWDLACTPGGTSSGSAVAVAVRAVPLAIAEQTAGSTLRPAAYCGVVGYKPTYGRISRAGCYPLSWSRDHAGVMGVSVADVASAVSVLAGPDVRDPTAIAESPPSSELDVDELAPPRIGLVRELLPGRIEDEMLDVVERFGRRLADAGADVSGADLPERFELVYAAADLLDAERASFSVPPEGKITRAAVAGLVPASYYVQAQRIRTWLAARLNALLAGYDALLMPAATGPAPRGLDATGDSGPLVPWSAVGFPALTIPAGLGAAGLPLGVQLVGAPRADHRLLRVGAWSESVVGSLPAPPFAGVAAGRPARAGHSAPGAGDMPELVRRLDASSSGLALTSPAVVVALPANVRTHSEHSIGKELR